MESDDALILRCSRDPAAFRELVQRYKARLFGFLVHLAGRDSADDLFQDVWLRVLRAAPRYEARGQAAGWLFKIARGVALNHLSRAGRIEPTAPEDAALEHADREPSPHAALEREELAARIDALVLELPREQREVFLLRELGRLSFAEIAELVGVPLGTTLSRMSYAVRKLRARLEGEYV